jgi:hypothetical protein
VSPKSENRFSHASPHLSPVASSLAPPSSIFTIPKLGVKLKQDVTPLSYTPRRFVSHPTSKVFYVIESDHRTHSPSALKRIAAENVRLLFIPSCAFAID